MPRCQLQAAHLLAELHKQDQQRAASQQAASTQQPSTSPADTAAASQPSPSLAVQLAIRLAARGYDVVLRTCFPTLHGGVADDDANTSSSQEQQHKQQQQQRQGTAHNLLASGLRHTFVRVSQPLHAHEAVVLPAVIVDPLFKDQWVMPHATQRWGLLLSWLASPCSPYVFVQRLHWSH
jgi:hypothetical protein